MTVLDTPPRTEGALRRMREGTVNVLCLAGLMLVLFLSWTLSLTGNSADLVAIYAASTAFAQGDLHLIYPRDADLFKVLPPPEWYPMMAELGHNHELYPYIYPPLWAALGSRIVGVVPLETFVAFAKPVNFALMFTAMWLALRIAGPGHRPLPFFALASVVVLTTIPGTLALQEDQPQILVTVLVLLAIERSLAGAPAVAGAALAFAAALKGAPALFVLVWIFAGHWRAAGAFALWGAALAGLSLALSGMALHQDFLRMLGVISDTAILTNTVMGFVPLVAQFAEFGAEDLVIRGDLVLGGGATAKYVVIEKAPLLTFVGMIAPVAILCGLGWRMRTASRAQIAIVLWPSALLWSAFFAPLPWAYVYIGALAFVPALLARAPLLGWLGFAAAMSQHWLVAGRIDLSMWFPASPSTLGALAMVLIGLVMALSWGAHADRRLPSAGGPV